jgi:hypothetical protein
LGMFLSQAAQYLTPSYETEEALRSKINLPHLSEAEYEASRAAEAATEAQPQQSESDDDSDIVEP